MIPSYWFSGIPHTASIKLQFVESLVGKKLPPASTGRSQSKTWNCSSVTCWNCKEVGHFRNQCPNDKQVRIAEDSVDEDLLVCCAESSVDSWVMDSGASFHATHNSEAL